MGILVKFALRCWADVRQAAAAFGLLIVLTVPPLSLPPHQRSPRHLIAIS